VQDGKLVSIERVMVGMATDMLCVAICLKQDSRETVMLQIVISINPKSNNLKERVI
jgi:hypothetical protein